MTDQPWAIALASTFGWSAFDAMRKSLAQKVEVAALSFWLSVAQIPGYLLWALFEGKWTLTTSYVYPALASIALNLVSNIAFLEAMRIAPLSIAVPMLSFTPVFVAIASGPMLGETLILSQWCGIGLVTLGAFALSASGANGLSGLVLLRSFFGQRGVRLMLWVALFWALTPIYDKLALRETGVGVHGAILSSGVAFGMFVYLLARGRLASMRLAKATLPYLALGGVTNVAALGLQFVAIGSMVVSFFEAFKRAIGLFIALGTGRFFFGEPLTTKKLLSGVVMALGVVLVLVRL